MATQSHLQLIPGGNSKSSCDQKQLTMHFRDPRLETEPPRLKKTGGAKTVFCSKLLELQGHSKCHLQLPMAGLIFLWAGQTKGMVAYIPAPLKEISENLFSSYLPALVNRSFKRKSWNVLLFLAVQLH